MTQSKLSGLTENLKFEVKFSEPEDGVWGGRGTDVWSLGWRLRLRRDACFHVHT